MRRLMRDALDYFGVSGYGMASYPRRQSENGYFLPSLHQTEIIIPEIRPGIPGGVISAVLDFGRSVLFSDSLLVEGLLF